MKGKHALTWTKGTRQDFIDSGYSPIPEDEIEVDAEVFQETTMNKILATEGPYSFYGHRGAWRNIFKADVYTLPKVLSACGREIRDYFLYKSGLRPAGTDVPQGCDDQGIIRIPRGPAIVTGSGPSLDTLMPIIKDWKGGIITNSASQASAMIYHGVHPTHALLFDAMETFELFSAIPWDHKKTTIITHPGIDPRINTWWKGNIHWYKIFSPNSIYYSELMRMAYDFIGSTHHPFACSASGQIAFAHAMGYDPIILAGCDFAFTEKQTRHTQWFCKKDKLGRKKWTSPPNVGATDYAKDIKRSLLTMSNSGYMTHRLHMYYAKTAMAVYWLDTPHLVDCSDGLLTGLIPKGDLKEIVATQGRCLKGTEKTREEIRRFIEPWIASRGSFYIPLFGGHKLIDTMDWEHEMPMLLHRVKEEDENLDIDAIMAYIKDIVERVPTMDYGPNSMETMPTKPAPSIKLWTDKDEKEHPGVGNS